MTRMATSPTSSAPNNFRQTARDSTNERNEQGVPGVRTIGKDHAEYDWRFVTHAVADLSRLEA